MQKPQVTQTENVVHVLVIGRDFKKLPHLRWTKSLHNILNEFISLYRVLLFKGHRYQLTRRLYLLILLYEIV